MVPQIGPDNKCVLGKDGKCSLVVYTTEFCPQFVCENGGLTEHHLEVGSESNLKSQTKYFRSEDIQLFLKVRFVHDILW